MDDLRSGQQICEDLLSELVQRVREYRREQEHPVRDPIMILNTRERMFKALSDFERRNIDHPEL